MTPMHVFCQDKLEWLSPIEFKQKDEPQKMPVLTVPSMSLQCNNCNCDPTLAERLKSLEEKYNTLEKDHNEVYSSYKRHLEKVRLEAVKPKTTSVPVVPLVNDVVPTRNKIVMYTSRVCPPCKRWKDVEYPKFARTGNWDIVIVETPNGLPTPNYEVTLGNGTVTRYVGYLAFELVN